MNKLLKELDKIGQHGGQAVLAIRDFSALVPLDVLGTGFLGSFEGKSYFVSALHNFKEDAKSCASIEIRGQRYSLAHRKFYYSEQDDIGFFELDEELEQAMAGLTRLPIGRDLGIFSNAAHHVVVVGFPADLRPNGALTALPVSTRLEVRDIQTSTQIPDARLYELENEDLVCSNGVTLISLLEPEGMSGGPVLACINAGTVAEPALYTKLHSVLVQWHDPHGYLVGSATARLVALIDSHSAGTARFL
ncbi:hypothetical protein HX810_29165 [Pseudomonas salomonii]|uniref:Trypsin-like peptidase domain-containing protein n=1 Tax=Pseudomonas salomonii TaxID=191391 RepID=A0A7Y8GJ30_9PSED|nr:hypothetical protein [Pseudomonas salomonii]NWF11749.1 hypothetical protein [Pseudomonas salomonii]